jgi:predicted metal-binding membrane protein
VTALRATAARHPEWSASLLALLSWLLILGVQHPLERVTLAASMPSMPGTGIGVMQMDSMPAMAMPSTGSATGHVGLASHLTTWMISWLVMSVAMMLPATLPTARYLALTALWQRRQRVIRIFLSSYLATWIIYGLAAFTLTSMITSLANRTETAATAFLVAALWELSSWKRRSLRACALLTPLPPKGTRADRAAAAAGLLHGSRCILSCWALMLVMTTTATLMLPLMIVISMVTFVQHTTTRGPRLQLPAAATILLLGLACLTI